MNSSIKYIISFFIIFLILSCGESDKKSETKENNSANQTEISINDNKIIISKDQFKSENMSLINLQKYTFATTIKTTGMIDVPPKNKVSISAYAGGYIKNSPLLIGDKVKKGQALVTIENLEFVELQQEYLEVLEQLNYLENEYERQKELFNEKIASKKSFLKAESEYKKTKAMFNGIHKKLQMLNINPASVKKGNISSVTTIYSPVNGNVTDIKVSTGTFVSPADMIMEIINTEHMHLELKVFEKDILKIKKNQKVIFRIPESSNESYQGEIHIIGKSINEDRTIQVHAHLDENLNHNFIVGMFVDAEIIIDGILANALIEEAVIEADNRYYVFILESDDAENYYFSKKNISIGNISNGFIQILDSLKNTDKYLLGAYNLISEED
ncbi:MAG: efflux RND transporter periplasmic adaptor subunit [Bacteroidota bacterium]